MVVKDSRMTAKCSCSTVLVHCILLLPLCEQSAKYTMSKSLNLFLFSDYSETIQKREIFDSVFVGGCPAGATLLQFLRLLY